MRLLVSAIVWAGLALPAAAQDFHTEPSCWDKPRIYHAGPPSDALARKIERTKNVTREPRSDAVISSNGGYKAWVEIPNAPTGNVADQILYVSSEQDRVTRFYIEQAQLSVTPTWINEKLVFVRVTWGRAVFSDMIIDAESGEILYYEEARDGTIAFQQYKGACNNTCPCDMSGIDDSAPSPSNPAEGEIIGLVELPGLLNHDHHEIKPGAPKAPLPLYIDNAGVKAAFIQIDDPAAIETGETGYEWAAASVFAKEPGWYKIGLVGDGKRKVWVKESDAGAYKTMPSLLKDSLAYLDADWDGRIWKSSDGKGGFAMSDIKDPGLNREEYAAEFSEIREIDSGTWLYVTLHNGDACDRSKETIAAQGWVPAWSEDGKLVGGYYSRGC